MRFELVVGKEKAIVLVDSNSTYNFLDTKLANRLALPIGQQNYLKVIVADGGVCLLKELVEGFIGKHRDPHL